MKTLIIVQARVASRRLYGKILEDIAGYSVLEHVVRRARHKGYSVVIASHASSAQALGVTAPWRQAVPDNRGAGALVPIYFPDCDEGDVLGRVAQTAKWANQMSAFLGAGPFGCVVRLTADCPFVPVASIDAVSEAVTSGENDYCETRSDPSPRPNGIDAQAMTMELLLEAHAKGQAPAMREHVTPGLLGWSKRPGRVAQLEGLRLDEVPGFRLTLDTPDDLIRYRAMAAHLSIEPTAGRPTLTELKDLHRRMPELFHVEPAVGPES